MNELSIDDDLNQLRRWCICLNDLQMSLSALTFLNEELDYDQETYNYVELRRLKCFELSFVVSYARVFTDSKGSRYQKLALKKIGIKQSEQERLLHDKIIKLRQKTYAHSDQDFAIFRLDLHAFPIRDELMHYPRVQADEGLHFTNFIETIQGMDMIRRTMDALIKSIQELSVKHQQRMPLSVSRIA